MPVIPGLPHRPDRPTRNGELDAHVQQRESESLGAAWRAAHVLALSAFAIAQPLLDILGENASFFVVRDTNPLDLIVFSLIVVIGPPLVLVSLTAIGSAVSRRAGWFVHVAQIFLLLTLMALPILDRILAHRPGEWAGVVVMGAALSVAAVGTLVYLKATAARMFVSLLAPAPLVFLVVFFHSTGVAQLMRDAPAPDLQNWWTGGPLASVVLVVFDEIPVTSLMDAGGGIDRTLFPHFAAFASESTWFRNASTSHTSTRSALPAILSGKTPSDFKRLPTQADHPRTLCTWLRPTHRIVSFESMMRLCPSTQEVEEAPPTMSAFGARIGGLSSDAVVVYAHVVTPTSWRDLLPSIAGGWGDFAGGGGAGLPARPAFGQRSAIKRVRENPEVAGESVRGIRFRAFVESIRPGSTPGLYFHHTMLVHRPWLELPTGQVYAAPGMMEARWRDAEEAGFGYQRHLLSLGYADRMLGLLVQRLRELGIYDDAIVILTADHGISFQAEGTKRSADQTNMREIIGVPLFVKRSGQTRGNVSDRNVESIDILPTVADLLGVALPWRVDGVSAFGDPESERKTKIIHTRVAGRRLEETGEVSFGWPAIRERSRLFGEHPSWNDVYAMGPRPDLLGTSLSEVSISTHPSCRLVRRNVVPEMSSESASNAYFSRIIRCRKKSDLPGVVVLSLGGIIRGSTRVVSLVEKWGRRRAGFEILLPGENPSGQRESVRIFALDGDDALIELVERPRPAKASSRGG